MTIKLWHCAKTRSLRVVWALEEMNLDFELECLPFPPRIYQKAYLEINPLGGVPFFVDGDIRMQESVAICQYLAEAYQKDELRVSSGHRDYGAYLNWLFYGESTLMLPSAVYIRATRFLAKFYPNSPEADVSADDYRNWHRAMLTSVDLALETRDYLCDERFTLADISVGYVIYFADMIELSHPLQPQTHAYLERIKERPAFKRAVARTDGLELKSIL